MIAVFPQNAFENPTSGFVHSPNRSNMPPHCTAPSSAYLIPPFFFFLFTGRLPNVPPTGCDIVT